ncbi:peptide-methionine (S)-S-oxide reductase [Endozoicomonas sp. OPT23]|uniref:peptide-methionine (S)-S-oxide reductase MsrA n=1 Tax=Endozoicomonas sp. OPT23 TaxID=2072845 RepID=UPI00129A189E|nr:peptide-methionine (S)-S-oxide reductase MsrA [Endozoicomonas sp. OPT23]MRI34689.1 peptide-methionine (S)-S-oxide reductase [Endozoicomonas sp. OPT23]
MNSKLKWLSITGLALGISLAVAGSNDKQPTKSGSTKVETAIFAGGCFWCTESDFEKVDGVLEAVSGYTAGPEKDPTYRQVSSGRTGHTEAVKVTFNPAKVSYQQLVDIYWKTIDPTVENRQFCDSGSQYRTGIYYQGKKQEAAAVSSLKKLEESKRFKKVYTEVEPFKNFYPAEGYHQDYYKKNPVRYKFYRYNCGRDQRLKEIWGKPAK